jgi:hypothetical protein
MQQNENQKEEKKTTYVVVSQKDENSIVDLDRLNKAMRTDGHIGI